MQASDSMTLIDQSAYCHTETFDQVDFLANLEDPAFQFKQPVSHDIHARRKSSTHTPTPIVTTRQINIAPIVKLDVVLSAITSEDFYLVVNVQNVTGTRVDEKIGVDYVLKDVKITMSNSVVNLELVNVRTSSFNVRRAYPST